MSPQPHAVEKQTFRTFLNANWYKMLIYMTSRPLVPQPNSRRPFLNMRSDNRQLGKIQEFKLQQGFK